MFKPSRSVETSSPDLMLLQSVDYAWSASGLQQDASADVACDHRLVCC